MVHEMLNRRDIFQVDGDPNDPVKLINDGRIHYRKTPQQQSLEDWNDFWSEYKNA